MDPTKTLQLQFNKDHGFGIEYHRFCAYDKLHIYDNLDNSRLARLCGPKDGDVPFDGAQKLKRTDGVMEMWDVPYDSHSNQILVAFDTDRDMDSFAGFELQWTATEVYDADFRNYRESLEWLSDKLMAIVNRRNFNGHGRSTIKKGLKNYLKVAKNAINRNRECARGSSNPVSRPRLSSK